MAEKTDLAVVDSGALTSISHESGFYKYLREVNKIPSLTQEEEFLLAKAFLEKQDLSAAHKLVTSHLKLVAKIALKFKNYGLPVPELVSEGNIGLMQAVKKYNPDLGFRLSTYAMWWIKASIHEYILKSWSLVKIGTTAAQKKLFFSLSKVKNKISNLYSRAINDSDFGMIADELGVTVKEVTEMNSRLSGADLSLNSKVNREEGKATELLEFIPEPRAGQEISLINKEDNTNKHNLLVKALDTLGEREAKILKARKLLESPLTLDELSVRYNISKERVRQIENRAFEKIQTYMLSAMKPPSLAGGE